MVADAFVAAAATRSWPAVPLPVRYPIHCPMWAGAADELKTSSAAQELLGSSAPLSVLINPMNGKPVTPDAFMDTVLEVCTSGVIDWPRALEVCASALRRPVAYPLQPPSGSSFPSIAAAPSLPLLQLSGRDLTRRFAQGTRAHLGVEVLHVGSAGVSAWYDFGHERAAFTELSLTRGTHIYAPWPLAQDQGSASAALIDLDGDAQVTDLRPHTRTRVHSLD
jgi:hypothetical protein